MWSRGISGVLLAAFVILSCISHILADGDIRPTPACPDLQNCTLACLYGPETDDFGCELCACFDPCKDASLSCTSDEVCEIREVQCKRAPCYPIGICVKKTDGDIRPTPACPDLQNCTLACLYGPDTDDFGCELCACFDPCKDASLSCTADEVCEIREVQCIRAPCYPIGICVQKTGTPEPPLDLCSLPSLTGPCKALMPRWYFSSERLDCLEFDYGGCEGNGNNFETREECLSYCGPAAASSCPPVPPCPQPCVVLDNGRGCNECMCPDTRPPSTAFPSTESFSKLGCPEIMCEVGCTMQRGEDGCNKCICGGGCPVVSCSRDCQYGSQKDSNGCSTCSCLDPCLNMTCSAGEICTYKQQPVCEHDLCRMLYVGQCTAISKGCPTLNCTSNCTYGTTKDSNKCDTCNCFQPCEGISCDVGQVCKILSALTCVNDQCEMRHVGMCGAACQTNQCNKTCDYGNMKDSNNCYTCECFDPCKDVVCGDGQVCKPNVTVTYVGEGGAITKVYVGQCEQRPPCNDRVMCAMYCPYGFLKDSNGCNTCRCYDPCQNKTCDSMSACQRKAVTPGPNQPYSYIAECVQCSGSLCFMACDYGFVKITPDCPICQCFEPCKDINCTVGKENCVVSATQTTDEYWQNYKGECKPICNNNNTDCTACPFGFETDAECGTCKCKNPCQGARCRDGLVCKPTRDPNCIEGLNNACDYSPLCISPSGQCDQDILTFQMNEIYPVSNNITYSNCDNKGNYKPMQCNSLGRNCSCTGPDGQLGFTGMQMNDAIEVCYPPERLVGYLTIFDCPNIVRPGKEYEFKRNISTQLSQYLQQNDTSVVTITKFSYYGNTTHLNVSFVVASLDSGAMQRAQSSAYLALAELYETTFEYGDKLYRWQFENYISTVKQTTTQSPSTWPTSEPTWYHGLTGAQLLALVIILPLAAAATLAAVLIICICKFCKQTGSFEPMSNRSSGTFEYVTEKAIKLGYENPNYDSNKVQPPSVNFYQ